MSQRLIDGLVTTDALAGVFDDESIVAAMLEFEAALAKSEATCGVIPEAAAVTIGDVASALRLNPADLLPGLRANATLTIPVVQALTAAVDARDPEAARFVHWGATSQDVFDTALVLCIGRAWASIAADHRHLVSTLDAMATRHAGTIMTARTLLQPAVPTTFGLKAARWLGLMARTWRSLERAFDDTQVVQFGGAAGTLASLGDSGEPVERALAAELGLGVPDAPWHAERDRLVTFVSAAAAYAAALGKMARDVSLLMQAEVAEVFEAGGGSSAMPHKRNPAQSAIVLTCAHRAAGLATTMLAASVQEHERAVGGWQVEAATVAAAVQTTGAAVHGAVGIVTGLEVDARRMRRNLECADATLAERVVLAAAPAVGRARAAALVRDAALESAKAGQSLRESVAASADLMAALADTNLDRLFDPASYLGSADIFRTRLQAAALSGSRES